jgi:predicted adenine nucleotide alpha hydrolase (AANH) superfamily ATPase
MFYSNSNIDTREEFDKRAAEAKRLAEADSVEIAFDGYDHECWLKEVAEGYEAEPEKGRRCERCFRFNLERTARYAAENGYDAFTTSLSVSPHMPSALVFAAGEEKSSDAVRFLREDFKKKEGFKISVRRASELGLYRQGYCGCEFSNKGSCKRDE